MAKDVETKDAEIIKIRVVEVIGFGLTVASVTACIVLWSVNYFQSKSAAEKFESDVTSRVSKVESTVLENANIMNKINTDVSYIRGRLEPK